MLLKHLQSALKPKYHKVLKICDKWLKVLKNIVACQSEMTFRRGQGDYTKEPSQCNVDWKLVLNAKCLIFITPTTETGWHL